MTGRVYKAIAICLAISLPGLAGPSFAGWPRPSYETPGPPLGETQVQWIHPYVRVLDQGIRRPGDELRLDWSTRITLPTVTWYSKAGEVQHEVYGVGKHAGFFQSGDRFFGVWPFWESPIRPKGTESNGHFASPSGRTLVHTYGVRHASREVFDWFADIYIAGQLARSLGPLSSSRVGPLGDSPRSSFHESGAVALFSQTSTQYEEGDSTDVIVLGPEGSGDLLIRVPSRAQVKGPSPSGSGVLYAFEFDLKWDDGKNAPVVLDSGPGTSLLDWTDEFAILRRGNRTEDRLLRVDLSTGATDWTASCPIDSSASTSRHEARLDREWLYVYAEERIARGSRHALHVLDTKSGRLLYRWRSTGQFLLLPRFRPCLVRCDGEVYFLTRDRFALLSREEVTREDAVWESMAPPSVGPDEAR